MIDRYDKARIAEKYAAEYNDRRHQSEKEMPIQDWAMLAWARPINPVWRIPNTNEPILQLGAGNRPIGKEGKNNVLLDLEHGWDGEVDLIDYDDNTFAGIWAHGFFEHISPGRVPFLLLECQRVLQPTVLVPRALNIVVPHSLSNMYPEDITHKCPWTEDTITNIFNNPYYEQQHGTEWKMQLNACFIMGVVWRNLGLFIQLVKPKDA
jgi:hypothetical protein